MGQFVTKVSDNSKRIPNSPGTAKLPLKRISPVLLDETRNESNFDSHFDIPVVFLQVVLKVLGLTVSKRP